jgi:hypothetical protein
LTPHLKNKFLGLAMVTGLAAAFAPSALAQNGDLSSYQGPGILSPGVGNVGSRNGEQVDLRYFGGVSGVYDSNPQTVTVDSSGNLVNPPNLYGVELNYGAYGSHDFRLSQLSLDYRGDYRHYSTPGYNGSDQAFTLGFTDQLSRRLVLDLRGSLGTLRYGYGSVAAGATSDTTGAVNQNSLFFDSRSYYARSTAALTFLASAKTSFSISGGGSLQDYNGPGLSNNWGYNVSGSMNRRMSKTVTIGAVYQHSYFESPGFGSQSTANAYMATFAAGVGRFWTLSVQAGVTTVDVKIPFNITLDPLLAALLGQPTLSGVANSHNIYPSGSASLQRQFQRANFNVHYTRAITAGNGAIATSRTENVGASLTYTGLRKISLIVSGGYDSSIAVGQANVKFTQVIGSAGLTYNLGHDLQLSARFDLRDQQIEASNYSNRGSRTTVGLIFSPGKVPLSLW